MNAAILVAAGKGTRMGAGVDKLFLEVAGRPVVAHTWQQFDGANCIGEIILVVRDGMEKNFSELAAKFHFQKPFRVVVGGAERQDSVWNGLEALVGDGGNCGHSGCGPALHERGADCRNGQGGG